MVLSAKVLSDDQVVCSQPVHAGPDRRLQSKPQAETENGKEISIPTRKHLRRQKLRAVQIRLPDVTFCDICSPARAAWRGEERGSFLPGLAHFLGFSGRDGVVPCLLSILAGKDPVCEWWLAMICPPCGSASSLEGDREGFSPEWIRTRCCSRVGRNQARLW